MHISSCDLHQVDSNKMASDSPKSVLAPAGLSTTSLPRRLLSHRWVITDAKVFLEKNEGNYLKSPNFTLVLPKKAENGDTQQQTTLWFLAVMKNGNYFHMYLYQGSREAYGKSAQAGENASTILVSDCTFKLVNLETGKALYECKSSECQRIVCNESPGSCAGDNFSYSSIDQYLHNGCLALQVDATILCLTDPTESIHEQRNPLENNVLAGIKSLLTDTSFADVTIKCANAEFKAHKAVLTSQSPVFKKMLESDIKEKETSVIEIPNVDRAVISDMLKYFYTGSAPNLDEHVEVLFDLADKYELSQLYATCEDQLKSKMNVTNVIDFLILADMHRAKYLKDACLNYIYHNSAAVHSTSEWKELRKNSDHVSLLVESLEYKL